MLTATFTFALFATLLTAALATARAALTVVARVPRSNDDLVLY